MLLVFLATPQSFTLVGSRRKPGKCRNSNCGLTFADPNVDSCVCRGDRLVLLPTHALVINFYVPSSSRGPASKCHAKHSIGLLNISLNVDPTRTMLTGLTISQTQCSQVSTCPDPNLVHPYSIIQLYFPYYVVYPQFLQC